MGLVLRQHAGRGDGFGFAKPVAAVLHQEHLTHDPKGAVFGGQLAIRDGAGDALGVNLQRTAHVERGFGRELVDPGQGDLERARRRRRQLGKFLRQRLELFGQLLFGRFLQLPDLLLALRIGLAQRAHVSPGQLLHVFFNLVGPQVLGQQGRALALPLRVQPVNAHAQ